MHPILLVLIVWMIFMNIMLDANERRIPHDEIIITALTFGTFTYIFIYFMTYMCYIITGNPNFLLMLSQ